MNVWRWLVGLFSSREVGPPPDDVRYYETLHRQRIDGEAANAARAVESGITHP